MTMVNLTDEQVRKIIISQLVTTMGGVIMFVGIRSAFTEWFETTDPLFIALIGSIVLVAGYAIKPESEVN